MRSSTRLDSAVFQLTPTRTRCDLIISANGKTEKIASGLVNPFLAHLKTAQDQMAKGGYSIILQPEPGSEASWFTRGTVERFVRFVSTPEVLERVYTLESEILQIEEAIALQSNNDIGLSSVEDHLEKSAKRIEGSKPLPDSNGEKAIVLYEPGAQPPVSNGLTTEEGNSKVQLMKVLETRKTVLQKEQGMAFARAVAAGFDMDHMAPLMCFAESFGALRLKDACVRFIDLWKRKHETGQWVEIEAAEAVASRSDFSAMNASGIVLSSPIGKHWPETPENNGKVVADPNADEKPVTDQQIPSGHPEYFQGQFPHPMFPPWPIHSPPGAVPVFQGYPMQGIPYYQNYAGNGPFFQPQYPSGDDPRSNGGQQMRRRRHSMDAWDGYAEDETWEPAASKARSRDDADLDPEDSGNCELRRKGNRLGKKKAGMVVIRNINYIASKREDSSGSDLESASSSEVDEEARVPAKLNSQKSSKGKGSNTDSMGKERTVDGKAAGGQQWEAFQSYLLKDADEAEHADKHGMFAMEKDIRVKRPQSTMGDDPLAYDGRDVIDNQEGQYDDMRRISGKLNHRIRASDDASLISRRIGQSADGSELMDSQVDLQSPEIYGIKSQYRRSADNFIIHGRQSQLGYTPSPSDPLVVNKFERDLDRSSSHNMDDDSYIVSLRSNSPDHVGTGRRNAIDMDSEFPSSGYRPGDLSNSIRSQPNYEPDELSLMPERGTEKETIGYDPALDYDMQVRAENGAAIDKTKGVADAGQDSKKMDKGRKLKLTPGSSDEKKNVGPIRKGKPSKLSPLDEARARAEKVRNYKADLQKMKKEKEEEKIKRLEALKLERQKRIATRSGSIPSQATSQQNRKPLPVKLSPSSHKGSKFSDAEPGSSSPLQRSSIRAVPSGSSDSLKASSKLSTGNQSVGSRLSRSVSSLPEPMKENSEVTPKASMARLRRLSEPKMNGSHLVSSVRTRKPEVAPKTKVSNAPDSKKITAILNHDKSKAASLPELKIRNPKGSDAVLGKLLAKEMPKKVNDDYSAPPFQVTELNSDANRVSHHSDGDDNPIVEKTVLILESEKPAVSGVHRSEESVAKQREWHSSNYKIGEDTGGGSDYMGNHAPVQPHNMDRVDMKPVVNQAQGQASGYQAKPHSTSNTQKEPPKVFSAEKPYQAPYARVSSLEDPSTINSEYGRAPPTNLQTVGTSADTLKALVYDSQSLKLEKIPESSEKPKESSKGFRRLLKFGRKSHATGEADNISVNGSEPDESIVNTSEVHMLKNLISQDETPTAGGSPQKTSRHFSLFSPFRSRTSEKKQTA